MKYGYNHGYVLLHFTDFFCLNIHYFYILFEYSVKMCMRVIDIPYIVNTYVTYILLSAARGVSKKERENGSYCWIRHVADI